MWTRSNRSFIAVSVHYFDPVTLNLETSFIACESFVGNHTNDRVAEKLRSIFDRYGILSKVFFITTDGGTEYVAALKYFGNNYKAIQSLNEEQSVDWLGPSLHTNAHNHADEQQHQQQDVDEAPVNAEISDENGQFDVDMDPDLDDEALIRIDTETSSTDDADRITVHDLFSDEDILIEDMPMLRKMNRVACSSHMLDKIGKKDSLNAKNDPDYLAIHSRVFKKLEEIWSLRDSRLYSEIYTRITGRKLIGPHRIRWMKTYDAVSCEFFFS